jgi:mono/diheme cytochrome c family protein
MPNKPLPFLVGILTCAIAAVAADKKPDISKLPAPAAKPGLTWDKDIKPIVDASCAKCHGGDKPKAKYRVDTKANFIKGGESDEKAVVAGKSAESPVVLYTADLVEDMEMPPPDKRDKYPALTKDQIALLRAWIDQGAK